MSVTSLHIFQTTKLTAFDILLACYWLLTLLTSAWLLQWQGQRSCTLLSLFHQNPGPQQAEGMVPFCLRHLILSAECCPAAGRFWVWATAHLPEKLCASAGKGCHFQIGSLLLLSPENCRPVFKRLCPVVFLEELLAHLEQALHHPQGFCIRLCEWLLLSRWVASLHHFAFISALFFRNIRKMPASQTRKISKRARSDNLVTKILAVPL